MRLDSPGMDSRAPDEAWCQQITCPDAQPFLYHIDGRRGFMEEVGSRHGRNPQPVLQLFQNTMCRIILRPFLWKGWSFGLGTDHRDYLQIEAPALGDEPGSEDAGGHAEHEPGQGMQRGARR